MMFKAGKADARLGHLSAFTRYLIGFALFGAALAARFALIGILPREGFPFLTFFPAVFVTAYLADLGPGWRYRFSAFPRHGIFSSTPISAS